MKCQQWGKLFDTVCVKLFQCFPNLKMKFRSLFQKDRIICRFLDQHMPEHVFIACRLDQTRVQQILDMRVQPAVQVSQPFQHAQVKRTTDHCRVLQNVPAQFGQTVNARTEHSAQCVRQGNFGIGVHRFPMTVLADDLLCLDQ